MVAETTLHRRRPRVARRPRSGRRPAAGHRELHPTGKQRLFITTRDRTCRTPNCGQRTGWADHDQVVSHAWGGQTTCTNLTSC
jgi:hypothetical protein